MEEEKHETLNIDTSSKSDEKSSLVTSTDSPGEPSQSEIMKKEQQELLHIDISDESDDETSSSSLIPTDSLEEPSQSEIMEEEQQELFHGDIPDESDETSSSALMSTDSSGEPSQSEIMEEEQQELLHVDIPDESDETSSFPLMSTDSSGESSQLYIIEEEKEELLHVDISDELNETSLSPPTSMDSPGEPSQSEIMKKEQQKLHHVDISGKSDEKSSSPLTSKDSAGEPSQSEIMEKEQQKLHHIDISGESDEKSSSSLTSKDSAGKPSQSKIMEKEEQKFHRVDISGESDEKSSSPLTSKDSAREPSESEIMEKEQQKLHHVDISGESDEKSSPPAMSKDSSGESTQSKIMEERQHELLNVNTSGKSDEKLSASSTSNDFDGVSFQSDMKEEKHKSLNDDTSAESDEKSLVLWRPFAPPIQDLEAKSRTYKLLMSQVFTRESCLMFNYKRERRSSLPTFTTILKLLAICPSPPESTTSELSDVIEKSNTSKFDLNPDFQSSKKCIFTKQTATKTLKDSTNESNSSMDDEPYIDAEQSTHSATHTDDIRNLELPDNQEKIIEESPPECPAGVLILIVSFPFVALLLVYLYLLPFYPLGLSLGQNLEHTDTFTSVIVELEEKILDHDETIRALAEYLQQDTPLLKVVALISNASVDKSYTIDIIRNKFARRSGNERVSLYPSFTVLENLSLKNFKVVIDFVNMCQRVYPHDQQITILADFPINDDLTHIDLNRAINTLKKTFIKAHINIKILLYKPLNEEALEKYIQNMAENIGESFSQIQIDDIKRHLIEGNCKKANGHCYGN